MRKIVCEKYTSGRRKEWDNLVSDSRNGTFLIMRDYMEYHADRFTDHSLMFISGSDVLALLPANQDGDTLLSHGGLTYGGFIMSHRCTGEDIMEIFLITIEYMRNSLLKRLVYKPVPHIYHKEPAEEDLYAAIRYGAHLTQRALSSTISMPSDAPFSELRRRCIKKGLKSGLAICQEDNYSAFWNILTDNLEERHSVSPVHTIDEINLLKSLFPQNIRLYTAALSKQVVAGVIIYETTRCAHAQYIASTPEGREVGALDVIFSYLITERYRTTPYFDFGISTEQGGTLLNIGLLSQKEGFGARGTLYDTYEINI